MGFPLGRSFAALIAQNHLCHHRAVCAASFCSKSTINFLIKPVNQEAFFSTLNLALSKIEAEDEVITVKTKAGIFVVPISNILCCEYIARGVTYQLASGEKLHGLSLAFPHR